MSRRLLFQISFYLSLLHQCLIPELERSNAIVGSKSVMAVKWESKHWSQPQRIRKPKSGWLLLLTPPGCKTQVGIKEARPLFAWFIQVLTKIPEWFSQKKGKLLSIGSHVVEVFLCNDVHPTAILEHKIEFVAVIEGRPPSFISDSLCGDLKAVNGFEFNALLSGLQVHSVKSHFSSFPKQTDLLVEHNLRCEREQRTDSHEEKHNTPDHFRTSEGPRLKFSMQNSREKRFEDAGYNEHQTHKSLKERC
jgi:hypothetical protein